MNPAFIENLREITFLNNDLLKWAGLLASLLIAGIAGKILSLVLTRNGRKLLDKDKMQVPGLLMTSIGPPLNMLFLAAGLYFGGLSISLTPEVENFYMQVCETLAVLAATWFLFKLTDIIEFFLNKWTDKTETTLDDQLVPIIRKSLRVFVVVIGVLFIAQNVFQWDIGAMIAGLGIGGLAIALAAKDMLSNIFGSITIFADRPFAMGDRIKTHDYDGFVEAIGFRTTRLRMLNGHLVTIPNGLLAGGTIENISKRPFLKRVFQAGVTYDTPPEKVKRALEIIHEMAEARKDQFAEDQPLRAYFTDFAASSLVITITYWFAGTDWWEFQEFNDGFNMELLERYNREGIEFAFDTQTLYIKKD